MLNNKANASEDISNGIKNNIIISITSFPERIHILHLSLYSLLTQSIKAEKVILWLAHEQFPNKEADLPSAILDLKEIGLEIYWCHDIKSYKKLIPALKEFPEHIIITADDDILYRKTWLEELLLSYEQDPKCIHAYRAHEIQFADNGSILPYMQWKHCVANHQPSFAHFATGAGGILYPPHCLDKEVFNEEGFMTLAPLADDIWFWAMALKNNTKTKIMSAEHSHTIEINAHSNDLKLYHINGTRGGNDKQLKNVLTHYNLYDKLAPAFDSANYWENRYAKNGNSGAGSYNRLAQFKADVLNDFCSTNDIKTVIEFGSGDGNNLSLYTIKNYTGFDVSYTALDILKEKFKDDSSKQFFHTSEFNTQKAELSLSFDVIFHLIEDDVFNNYMENLFNSSTKYIMIYASNKDEEHVVHVKHRKFTKWISKYKKDWKLKQYIKNKYPYDEKNPDHTSFADFYIFEKTMNA